MYLNRKTIDFMSIEKYIIRWGRQFQNTELLLTLKIHYKHFSSFNFISEIVL